MKSSASIQTLFAVTALLLALDSCAAGTKAPAKPQPMVQAVEEQAQWLLGLARGQPVAEVLQPRVADRQYLLEVADGAGLYLYVAGYYMGTDTLYGLYFEDGRLAGLLLDQDVTDFSQCETTYRRDGERWLRDGMAPVTAWIAHRNRLGQDFDARVAHPPRAAEGRADGGNLVEVVTHLPLAMIALPFYGVYWAAGGLESDAREEEAVLQRAGRLRPGTIREPDLQSLLGQPDSTTSWGAGRRLLYRRGTVAVGVVGGSVRWKQIGFTETPMNASTQLGDADCEGMKE